MIVYRYNKEENEPVLDGQRIPPQAFLAGVPLRDLTQADVAALSDDLRASVETSGLFTKAKKKRTAVKEGGDGD